LFFFLRATMAFIRIALDGVGTFTVLGIAEGDTLMHLVKRACAKFPDWGPEYNLSLYLVAAGGDDMPPPSAVASARHLDQLGWPLSRAEIFPGAWLVARKIANCGALFLLCSRLCSHSAGGLLHSPQRRPHRLSTYSIGHEAHSTLQATHYWLAAAVLRVGNNLFAASPGMETCSRRAASHEPLVLDGRQEDDSNVGGHLPRHVLDFGVDSAKSGGGTLKEE
jgi:hypothetical protein